MEYFNGTKEKAKIVYNNVLERVTELEKLRLMVGAGGGGGRYDECSENDALINSNRSVQSSIVMVGEIEASLNMQMNSIDKIKKRVGDFIGELNIGKSLIRMIGNRSAEDYRLILVLTGILVL